MTNILEDGKTNKLKRIRVILEWVSIHWAICAFFLTIAGALVAWLVYGISLLQPFEEIAYKQKQYRHENSQRELRELVVERHLALAGTLMDIGRYEAAEEEYKKVLKLDAVNLNAQTGIFEVEVHNLIIAHRNPDVIKEKINFLLTETPDNPHALVFLGDLFSSLDKEKAEGFYQQVISAGTKTATAYFGLGVLYSKEPGKEMEVIELYKKAVELSHWNEDFLNNLGGLYFKTGQYDEAIKAYEKILTMDSEYLITYLEIANVLRMSGELQWALAYYKQLVNFISDKEIIDLPENQKRWFFNSGENEVVYLNNPLEKRFYAYYCLSISLFLSGRDEEAKYYVNEAQKLAIDNEHLIINLVTSDLNAFIEIDKNRDYTGKGNDYRKSFLNDEGLNF